MIFHTISLLSKWGFNDGDILDGHPDERIRSLSYDEQHDLLFEVVQRYILPHLRANSGKPIRIVQLSTTHNPVRVSMIGEETTHHLWYEHTEGIESLLKPESIEVKDDDIVTLAIEKGMIDEST